MTTHELKTWPGPFEATWRGDKRFEFRVDDSSPPFAVGDTLVLWEYAPDSHLFLDRKILAEVTYLIRGNIAFGSAFGVPAGYVIMSIRIIGGLRRTTGLGTHGTPEWVGAIPGALAGGPG